MAKYKVILTVKDRYGTVKEIDGGSIETPVYVPGVTDDDKLAYVLERGRTEEYLEFDLRNLADIEKPEPGNPTEPGDTPEAPTEENTIAAKIMAKKLPMYQVSADGQLHEVAYVYSKLTPETAQEAPEQACFYQIIDGNTVLESGYQQFASYENELFYMIALPDIVKMTSADVQVSAKIWDAGASEWVDTAPDLALQLTCDFDEIQAVFAEAGLEVPEVPVGYTLWVNLSEVNNGEKIRFAIMEVTK
jgi:hypothetical protein